MLRVSFANAGAGLPHIPRQLHKNIVYLKRVYPESSHVPPWYFQIGIRKIDIKHPKTPTCGILNFLIHIQLLTTSIPRSWFISHLLLPLA